MAQVQMAMGMGFAGGEQILKGKGVDVEGRGSAEDCPACNGKQCVAEFRKSIVKRRLQPVQRLAQIFQGGLFRHFRPEQGGQRLALVRPVVFQRQVKKERPDFVGAKRQGPFIGGSRGCTEEG
jgi:hypothetical protein